MYFRHALAVYSFFLTILKIIDMNSKLLIIIPLILVNKMEDLKMVSNRIIRN